MVLLQKWLVAHAGKFEIGVRWVECTPKVAHPVVFLRLSRISSRGGSNSAPPDVTPATPGCSNDPSNWLDSDADDCEWYAEGSNCADFGDGFAGVGGLTANEACCAW